MRRSEWGEDVDQVGLGRELVRRLQEASSSGRARIHFALSRSQRCILSRRRPALRTFERPRLSRRTRTNAPDVSGLEALYDDAIAGFVRR